MERDAEAWSSKLMVQEIEYFQSQVFDETSKYLNETCWNQVTVDGQASSTYTKSTRGTWDLIVMFRQNIKLTTGDDPGF